MHIKVVLVLTISFFDGFVSHYTSTKSSYKRKSVITAEFNETAWLLTSTTTPVTTIFTLPAQEDRMHLFSIFDHIDSWLNRLNETWDYNWFERYDNFTHPLVYTTPFWTPSVLPKNVEENIYFTNTDYTQTWYTGLDGRQGPPNMDPQWMKRILPPQNLPHLRSNTMDENRITFVRKTLPNQHRQQSKQTSKKNVKHTQKPGIRVVKGRKVRKIVRSTTRAPSKGLASMRQRRLVNKKLYKPSTKIQKLFEREDTNKTDSHVMTNTTLKTFNVTDKFMLGIFNKIMHMTHTTNTTFNSTLNITSATAIPAQNLEETTTKTTHEHNQVLTMSDTSQYQERKHLIMNISRISRHTFEKNTDSHVETSTLNAYEYRRFENDFESIPQQTANPVTKPQPRYRKFDNRYPFMNGRYFVNMYGVKTEHSNLPNPNSYFITFLRKFCVELIKKSNRFIFEFMLYFGEVIVEAEQGGAFLQYEEAGEDMVFAVEAMMKYKPTEQRGLIRGIQMYIDHGTFSPAAIALIQFLDTIIDDDALDVMEKDVENMKNFKMGNNIKSVYMLCQEMFTNCILMPILKMKQKEVIGTFSKLFADLAKEYKPVFQPGIYWTSNESEVNEVTKPNWNFGRRDMVNLKDERARLIKRIENIMREKSNKKLSTSTVKNSEYSPVARKSTRSDTGKYKDTFDYKTNVTKNNNHGEKVIENKIEFTHVVKLENNVRKNTNEHETFKRQRKNKRKIEDERKAGHRSNKTNSHRDTLKYIRGDDLIRNRKDKIKIANSQSDKSHRRKNEENKRPIKNERENQQPIKTQRKINLRNGRKNARRIRQTKNQSKITKYKKGKMYLNNDETAKSDSKKAEDKLEIKNKNINSYKDYDDVDIKRKDVQSDSDTRKNKSKSEQIINKRNRKRIAKSIHDDGTRATVTNQKLYSHRSMKKIRLRPKTHSTSHATPLIPKNIRRNAYLT